MTDPEIGPTMGAHEAPRYGIPAATIRSWAHRGKLRSRGLDAFDRPLYSVTDVLALANPTRHDVNAA